MIRHLHISNFRGVRRADLELAPITILTGYNNAGKSTIPYALLTLKNVTANPNQLLDSFFNLGFLNLSGFKQAVFLKDEEQSISLAIQAEDSHALVTYELLLGKHSSSLRLTARKPFELVLKLDVTFPYALNLSASQIVPYHDTAFRVSWNGLTATLTPVSPEEARDQLAAGQLSPDFQKAQTAEAITRATQVLNMAAEELRKIDMVPLRRGFTKPVYAAVPIQPQLLTEDEVAPVLATDSDLLGRVDLALEYIVNRNLRVHVPMGTATFYLHSRDRATGMTCELVNEGFGTNQLTFLLGKLFREGVGCVCVEEPEIHLHPSAISRFAELAARTATDSRRLRKRQFVFTSHSEHLVTSFLGLVAKGELSPSDLALYYVSKQDDETVVERCEVTEKGQVSGGLKGFYEAELAAVKSLVGNAGGV